MPACMTIKSRYAGRILMKMRMVKMTILTYLLTGRHFLMVMMMMMMMKMTMRMMLTMRMLTYLLTGRHFLAKSAVFAAVHCPSLLTWTSPALHDNIALH